MASTNFARDKMQDYNFGSVPFTPPTSYFIGLSTATISSSGSGATEPSGGGYARVEIPNTKSYFTYSSNGCLVNSASIVFAQTTGSLGTILSIGLWDALTSGSLWYYTNLTTPKIVQTDTVISYSASAITFSQTQAGEV